jgi:hypothetical protein
MMVLMRFGKFAKIPQKVLIPVHGEAWGKNTDNFGAIRLAKNGEWISC